MSKIDFIEWHSHCLHIDSNTQSLKCCRCKEHAELNDIQGTSLVQECPSSLILLRLNPDPGSKYKKPAKPKSFILKFPPPPDLFNKFDSPEHKEKLIRGIKKHDKKRRS